MRREDIKNKKSNKVIKIIIGLILVELIIFSIIKIVEWNKDNKRNSEKLAEIKNQIVVENDKDGIVELDTTNIKSQYPNVVGWLKVGGTEIDYPIVQGDDNSFYLNHSIDNSYNEAGWMFVDYQNYLNGTDNNIVIYGHNRRDGSQFGSMKNILNKEWYDNDDNKYVTFITEKMSEKYEVFSVYKIENEDYYITTSFKNDEFEKFINNLKNRSIKDFNVRVIGDDSILTLSTCANNNKYRVVLHAKKVK